MNRLYLTRSQAASLAEDLAEYSKMADSHNRELFKGFIIFFGDNLAKNLQPDESFEMIPITEYTEIVGE